MAKTFYLWRDPTPDTTITVVNAVSAIQGFLCAVHEDTDDTVRYTFGPVLRRTTGSGGSYSARWRVQNRLGNQSLSAVETISDVVTTNTTEMFFVPPIGALNSSPIAGRSLGNVAAPSVAQLLAIIASGQSFRSTTIDNFFSPRKDRTQLARTTFNTNIGAGIRLQVEQ